MVARLNIDTVGSPSIIVTDGTAKLGAATGAALSLVGAVAFASAGQAMGQVIATGVSAAGSAITDATDLTAMITNVTTTAASTGVQLFEAPIGAPVLIRNGGANALNVYPHSGSAAINGGSAGAAVAIAAGAFCLCVRLSATLWIACEPPAA